MKSNKSLLALALCSLLASGFSHAADKATVELQSKDATNKHVFLLSHIQAHLDELAQGLPEGQQLVLFLVNFGGSGTSNVSARVNRPPGSSSGEMGRARSTSVDVPNVTHLSFSYRLTDAKGSILKKDSVDLRRSFNLSGSNQSAVKKHKRLLTTWYKKTFA